MNLASENLRLSFLKAVADAVAQEMATIRAGHTSTLLHEWRQSGSKSWNVRLPGGPKVGTITLSEPKPSTEVVDAEAFRQWCAQNHSDLLRDRLVPATPAVEAVPEYTVTEVDPKAQTAFLARLKPVGEELVDPDTGSIVDGVIYKAAPEPKSFTVTYTPDGRDALAVAYRSGELDALTAGSVLPQIGGRS